MTLDYEKLSTQTSAALTVLAEHGLHPLEFAITRTQHEEFMKLFGAKDEALYLLGIPCRVFEDRYQ